MFRFFVFWFAEFINPSYGLMEDFLLLFCVASVIAIAISLFSRRDF